jgi:hypothetical protein
MVLEPWDWLVVAAYLVTVLVVGLVMGRRQASAEGYFLAGRQLRHRLALEEGFRRGVDAALVEPGDDDALAVALGRALADAEAHVGASSPAALEKAAAHAGEWSTEAQARRYLRIYERVAPGAAAGVR